VVAYGSVWVTNALDASVTRIDPGTNTVLHVVPVGTNPTGIAASAGYLWVTNQGDGTVTRFNRRTYEVDSPAVPVGRGPVGIAVAGGYAWVANNLDGTLARIDTNNMIVTSRTLATNGGAYGVAARGRDVWVSNENSGTLMRINPRSFRLAATLRLRGAPLGLGFVGGDLWFTNAAGGSAPHRGGVLTVVGTGNLAGGDGDLIADDLTLHGGGGYSQLAALTNDGLVGFRRADGVQGAGIVPDLATSLPTPTEDGLSYTFHLRKGVRYSTGAPVLAGDIRRGIERSVVHPDSTPDYYRLAIEGANACGNAAKTAIAASNPLPGCDLRKGIIANDQTGTITFRLTRPTPEFLYQLALPNASAVPQDTPVDPAPGTFLPATGPYMIHSFTGAQLELVRNPYFHVWSTAAQPAGYPDRIVLETGYSAASAEAQVADGHADLVWGGVPGADAQRLSPRYGSRLHNSPGNRTDYLFLNAKAPPFNNPDARRAVAYALDRGALATAADGPSQPTCQLIPPSFAGYQPYCPFTVGGGADGKWTGPDLDTAKNLVRRSGTSGATVVVSVLTPFQVAVGKRIVATLNGLDYHATLNLQSDYRTLFVPNNDVIIGVTGWAADYPATSNYLGPIASCDPKVGTFNLSHFCNTKITAQIRAALAEQVNDPGAASDAWTAIDREVVDSGAVIPFENGVNQDFVSRRVRNLLVHPITGPLIAQMWVQ
jgi:peptide/nickel transport system substrate-binding protein